jgi:uncharacterized SAM-binding protein YcdF (DUF218 family)
VLWRILLAVLALLVAAWIAATLVLFFFPDEGAPPRADAVVVLSGTRGTRLDGALKLMRSGIAPVLVISNDPETRVREAIHLCRAGRSEGFSVVCFRPRPANTRGEAEAVSELAARNGWRSIVLVTSRFHVTRARMLFERCFGGKVDAVGVDYPATSIPAAVAGEWLKLAYALTASRDC